MKNKRNNGITLIALVVTIIVLLILAGISIAMLSGNNGILQRATEAKTYSDTSQIQERINLAYHSSLVDGQGKVTEQSLESELKKEFNKTNLDEGWLDTTSVNDKWRITIDDVYLDVPAGIKLPNSPLDVLIGKQKKDIIFNPSIQINTNLSAKFYDSDFNTCDDYIEYENKIYKLSYNLDYSSISKISWDTTDQTPGEVLTYNYKDFWGGVYPFSEFVVDNVTLTDIEISSLGKHDNRMITIVHGVKTSLDDSPYRWGETAVLFDDMLGTWNLAHVYSAEGILLGYPNSGDCSDHDEYGWSSLFDN